MKINNLSTYYSYKQPFLSVNRQYSQQTFGCNDSSDSKSFENFKRWANETNFLSNTKQILNNPSNLIGSGFEGKVYAIPNTENWVIKQYFRSNMIPVSKNTPDIELIPDISPELNIGQVIAKVNIPVGERYCETFFVHKKQNGKPIGVNTLLSKSVTDGTTKTHLESLELLANLPQESYKQLIDDIATISELGYKIDGTTPNNILLDSENKRINFVDIADKDPDKNSQYAEVLYCLLGASYGERFLESDRSDKEKTKAKQLSEMIIKKFKTSMNEKKAKFSPTYNCYSLVNTTPFREYMKKYNNQ